DDIGHAEALEHRAHRATGDDAGAGRSRTHVHVSGAETAETVVMQGPPFLERNADHLLLGRSGRLGDGFRHFACLAVAEAYPTLAVADHDERRKTEALAAL